MRIKALDCAFYSAYLNYHIWKIIQFMSDFTLGHSFTWAQNFQILWGHDINLLFSRGYIHKQKNKLYLILQTVTIIDNLLVTQMAQDQDLGVQGTRK